MDNAIPTRIYDFLKAHPPFSMFPAKDLMQVAERTVVKYYQPRQAIFTQGENPGNYMYIVREGAVHLMREGEQESQLVDECDEGDVFGIRPLLADQAYTLSAIAEEESLIYAVNIEVLRPVLENNPKAAWYLAQSFAEGKLDRTILAHSNHLTTKEDSLSFSHSSELLQVVSVEQSKAPITCSSQTVIRDAATIMRQHRVGSIVIVDDGFRPIGILTDRDFRNFVVTGDISLDRPVSEIMSKPVITIAPKLTLADLQMKMLKHSIHHLCLTENGLADTKVIGVISEHDLLVLQGNNPAILIREVRRCKNSAELQRIRERAESLMANYLEQEVAISFICNMMSEIDDAIIRRAIQLAEQMMTMEPPKIDWCWMALGSGGRQEQLLRTDQDNALVFADVPENNAPKAKAYFLDLASKITLLLHECGFEYCPAEMMASNPEWCLSLSEWKAQFASWIFSPTAQNILFCNIFFDFRPVAGEFSLAEELTEHIFKCIDEKPLFLPFLVRHALQTPPPLTFFRNFVVEKSGEHKDEFDIKARAMMPLTDAARVLILENKEPNINNTFQRFDRLAELDNNNRELFQQAADAYEILVRYRAIQGLKNKDNGRFLNPSELTKMQRLNLRNSFAPISDIQSLLKVRFRMSLMM